MLAVCQPAVPAYAALKSVLQITIGPSPLIVDLNFAANTFTGCASLTSCLTVTRTTAETCKDASGNITYQTSGNACITSGGLQIWASATNLELQSAMASTWTTGGTTSAINATPPDGVANTATTLTDNSGNTGHSFTAPVFTAVSGTTYTVSCFIQAGTLGFAQISQGNGIMSGNGAVNVNLSTGATATVGSNITSFGSEAYVNGWWRVWSRWAATASTTGSIFISMVTSNAAARAQAYVGSGSTIQLWGCQVEANTVMTPYIPTTTASVARNTDNIAVASASLLETTLNAATGTIVVNTNSQSPFLSAAAATIVDANGTIFLGKTTTNTLTTAVGASLSTATTGTWTGANDSGLAWDGTGGTLQLNAGTKATDAQARTPATTFHLGSTSGSSAVFQGSITRLRAYNDKEATPQ